MKQFDLSTQEGRAARRQVRLAELAPLGFSNANYVTKPDAERVLALLDGGAVSKAERTALEALRTRLVAGSIRITPKVRAEVRVLELAERIEQALA